MNILHVVGARPNFMKAAAVIRALESAGSDQFLVHTGQHYDSAMSEVFFRELDLPAPDVNLGVGSGTHACQTAEIMSRFEPVVINHRPDLVLVYGDVNSTIAAGLVCSKLGVSVAHVEAGLRSFDRTMPEEINRILTDQLSELLFTPSPEADENLRREGIAERKIHCVGNVMIDTMVRLLPRARKPAGLPGDYVLVTLHRPANVDDLPWLAQMMKSLRIISHDLPVIFPLHPRTRRKLKELGSELQADRVLPLDPLPYLDFLGLEREARAVITDSGGIQEETSFLGVPCLTVRDNTERPVTIAHGTNTLVGRNCRNLNNEIKKILGGDVEKRRAISLWDGRAGERIAQLIVGSAMAASA